jgi:cell division protein FtsW (lipid II flippase)
MAIIIAVAGGATMFVAGAKWRHLAVLAICGAAGGAAFLAASPWRWMRIQAMLDPGAGDNPCTYQLRQALTAVASGGMTGKGPGMGMMKYGFLPEDSTDFLFAVFCEEWGFAGAALLLVVLSLWLVLARRAAMRSSDRFGRVLAGSLGLAIILQAAMHVAVNLGALPPTGITLPFVSAGGTSLILMSVAAAMIVSVSSRAAGADAPPCTPGAVSAAAMIVSVNPRAAGADAPPWAPAPVSGAPQEAEIPSDRGGVGVAGVGGLGGDSRQDHGERGARTDG